MKFEDRPPEILAPVNALDEVKPLLGAGAHWLYGGVIPAKWASRFPSTVLLNQRTFPGAQFSSLEEIEEAVSITRRKGGSFALTLNAPFYMDEQMPMALELAGWASDAGVNALIVADPGLISRLGEEGNRLPLHLSTMGVVANAYSVDLYAAMGVRKVILPRFLNLDQIRFLITSSPTMEFEAFILVGKCPYIEGLCTFVHDSNDQRWPCEWQWDLEDEAGQELPLSLSGHFSGIRECDRRDGCGLCALPVLKSAGIITFKVVGRGAPLERKLQLIRELGKLLSDMPSQLDEDWIRKCKMSYHRLYGHDCCGHNCYYPEVYSSDGRPKD